MSYSPTISVHLQCPGGGYQDLPSNFYPAIFYGIHKANWVPLMEFPAIPPANWGGSTPSPTAGPLLELHQLHILRCEGQAATNVGRWPWSLVVMLEASPRRVVDDG